MTISQAIILGLIQGITEFLPISSSGHLVIAQAILGFSEPPILFGVLSHLATLVAVLVYFHKRLLKITSQQIFIVGVATFPAVIAGLFIEPHLEVVFSSLWIVAGGLLITSMLLFFFRTIEEKGVEIDSLPLHFAALVGLFQAFAILPGISRSGSTVVGSSLVGLRKKDAFYFSFLLAIPAILGAFLLQLVDLDNGESIFTAPYIIGFITAALSGLAALKLLEYLITTAKIHLFAWYCLALSILIILSRFVLL